MKIRRLHANEIVLCTTDKEVEVVLNLFGEVLKKDRPAKNAPLWIAANEKRELDGWTPVDLDDLENQENCFMKMGYTCINFSDLL